MPVGFGPRRIISTNSQVLVSNLLDGTLAVLGPQQLGVIQEISGLGKPREMALNSFYRRLFVTDAKSQSLMVVDVNANRLLKKIMLGAQPFGLAVVE